MKLPGILKTVDKITDVVEKAVPDKDKRNELIYNISLVLMQSEVAKYVRAVLAILTAVSCLFLGDKMTIDADTQKYILMAVFGFYFLDYLKGMFGNKK